MSLPEVNGYLHAVLVQKGMHCEFADSRINASARLAERARARFGRWSRPH